MSDESRRLATSSPGAAGAQGSAPVRPYTRAVTKRASTPLRSLLGQLALPLAGLLPLGPLGTAVPDPLIADTEFVRHPRARRYVLRLTRDGRPRVTVPRGGSLREAEAFLRRQAEWVARQRDRWRAAQAANQRSWALGGDIWFRGVRTPLRGRGEPGAVVDLGGRAVRVGPDGEVGAAVKRHLRALAARELPARTRELAAREQVPLSRVTVRDQRSRWGSCSPGGRISLNWRLVQMPPEVADYVIVHELMHVLVPNHSRRFWALVLRACPGAHGARRWIRRHGTELL